MIYRLMAICVILSPVLDQLAFGGSEEVNTIELTLSESPSFLPRWSFKAIDIDPASLQREIGGISAPAGEERLYSLLFAGGSPDSAADAQEILDAASEQFLTHGNEPGDSDDVDMRLSYLVTKMEVLRIKSLLEFLDEVQTDPSAKPDFSEAARIARGLVGEASIEAQEWGGLYLLYFTTWYGSPGFDADEASTLAAGLLRRPLHQFTLAYVTSLSVNAICASLNYSVSTDLEVSLADAYDDLDVRSRNEVARTMTNIALERGDHAAALGWLKRLERRPDECPVAADTSGCRDIQEEATLMEELLARNDEPIVGGFQKALRYASWRCYLAEFKGAEEYRLVTGQLKVTKRGRLRWSWTDGSEFTSCIERFTTELSDPTSTELVLRFE